MAADNRYYLLRIIRCNCDSRPGEVTSGSPSPCSGKNIAMAYVDHKYIKNGTPLQVQVRKRVFPATKVAMPFVPTQYYNPPK